MPEAATSASTSWLTTAAPRSASSLEAPGHRLGEPLRGHRRDVMRELPTVAPGDDAFDVLALLNQTGHTEALVEADGEFVGLLLQSDYDSESGLSRSP